MPFNFSASGFPAPIPQIHELPASAFNRLSLFLIIPVAILYFVAFGDRKDQVTPKSISFIYI